jgi:hypothetical protein
MLNNVQLILFFDVYNVIKLSKSCQVEFDASQADHGCEAGSSSSTERECQTDLHPIPFHKDESYVWNLWDLRRKAIELVRQIKNIIKLFLINFSIIFKTNLRRKQTTSAQTLMTYHKLDIANQRHENRQKSLQTDDSKETSTE